MSSEKHTPTPDNSTLRAPTAEEAHDMLMLRSVGAMTIAEGDASWQLIPLDCPMLVAVAALRNSHDTLVAALEGLLSACDEGGCFEHVSFEHPHYKPRFDAAQAALKAAQGAE